jgi:uncharacterized protein (DUF608 family)
MNPRMFLRVSLIACLFSFIPARQPAPEIPKVAWTRPLGEPLSNPGTRKNNSDINDGYWQGAPVGGFGAGTFSRTYRGDFARWHIKAGVHKYAPVYANQFAMFQQLEGDATGVARVLMTDHPRNGELSSWQWDYPVGAGEYAALYPKSGMTTGGKNFRSTWCWNSSLPFCPTIALKKIYAVNVMKFGNGEMGAANGMNADGTIMRGNEQGEEVWVGTTFGLAALMMSDGMKDEAYRTALEGVLVSDPGGLGRLW